MLAKKKKDIDEGREDVDGWWLRVMERMVMRMEEDRCVSVDFDLVNVQVRAVLGVE